MMTAALENILRGQPREATRLTAYIRGICSNLTKKEMRPKTDDNLVDLDLERISDSEKSVVDSLIEQERAAAVRQVLETLSFRDRNLLIDLFFHELSRDEACRKYAVTRGQLRVVLHHARRRFQKKWAR
jgi:RNA polymerase sigma factor (sigma-70 family)